MPLYLYETVIRSLNIVLNLIKNYFYLHSKPVGFCKLSTLAFLCPILSTRIINTLLLRLRNKLPKKTVNGQSIASLSVAASDPQLVFQAAGMQIAGHLISSNTIIFRQLLLQILQFRNFLPPLVRRLVLPFGLILPILYFARGNPAHFRLIFP